MALNLKNSSSLEVYRFDRCVKTKNETYIEHNRKRKINNYSHIVPAAISDEDEDIHLVKVHWLEICSYTRTHRFDGGIGGGVAGDALFLSSLTCISRLDAQAAKMI